MADFTQTIENRLGIYAADTTENWGSIVWGTDNWGYDEDVIVSIDKIIAESPTLTTALNFDVAKILTDTVTLTDTVSKDITGFTIAESISLSNVMDGLTLVDSEGFYHVFRGNTTEGEDKVVSSYTEISSTDPGWSEISPPSTSWS